MSALTTLKYILVQIWYVRFWVFTFLNRYFRLSKLLYQRQTKGIKKK